MKLHLINWSLVKLDIRLWHEFLFVVHIHVHQMIVLCSVHIRAETIKKNLILWALEIWDALRAAAEADLTLAQAIVDSAGIIVQSADLTICYDERGIYNQPHYFY